MRLEAQQADRMEQSCLSGRGIAREDARRLMALPLDAIGPTLALAARVRDHFRGRRVNLCSIVNAKSRLCGEDCKFCAQSLHYRTSAPRYPLLSAEELLAAARAAEAGGATCFSIVTSGERIQSSEEKATIEETVRRVAGETSLRTCASLGRMDEALLARLKAAGLVRVHHNLETNRAYFPRICSTHRYEDRAEMVRRVQRMGFENCTGGIVGMGETAEDRIALAFEIRRLGADSIPVNILNPIPGTPLEHQPVMEPDEVLRTLALFRLVHPKADIIVAGGRERSLGERQEDLFAAGASGILLGNYLTTLGRPPEEDLAMIERLGFVPARPECPGSGLEAVNVECGSEASA